MKLYKKILLITTALLSVGILFFHINQQQHTSEPELKTQLSGQEILNGFYLSYGPATKAMPTSFNAIKQSNKKLKLNPTQYKNAVSVIDHTIPKQDPEYFDSLKKAVYSKNYAEVKNDILKGQKYITAITDTKNRSAKNVNTQKLTTTDEKTIASKNGQPEELDWFYTNGYIATTYDVAVTDYGAAVAIVAAFVAPAAREALTNQTESQQNTGIQQYVNNVTSTTAATSAQ